MDQHYIVQQSRPIGYVGYVDERGGLARFEERFGASWEDEKQFSAV